MAAKKKATKTKLFDSTPEETAAHKAAASVGYIQAIAEITLRTSSQYVFVSDRGVQYADGITLTLGAKNCDGITVIRTDTKHLTEVVPGLTVDGDKITINAADFGESETLLFTANGKTPEGFAISACASVFRIPLSAGIQVAEDDMAAQAALVDDYFASLTKTPATIMKDTGTLVHSGVEHPTPPGVGTTVTLPNTDRTIFVGRDKRQWAVTDDGDVLVYDDVTKAFVKVDDDNEILDNLQVPRDKLVGIFMPRTSEIEDIIDAVEDDCEDCQLPEDKPKEIWSPVAQAQLLDWEEIVDEESRAYFWPDRELTIREPRAIFYKKDAIGVTIVVLDAQNVAFEIPPGYQFLIRHRRA